jgi:hypothetical protein
MTMQRKQKNITKKLSMLNYITKKVNNLEFRVIRLGYIKRAILRDTLGGGIERRQGIFAKFVGKRKKK